MIKNVIFDLSEVLIPGLIGIENNLESKTGSPKEVITKALGSHVHYKIGNVLDELFKGNISYEVYRNNFLVEAGLQEEYGDLFDHECLKMFEIPYDYTEKMIIRVATTCKIFLLSDHCETWASHILRKHGFFSHFEDILWSYEIGATKKEMKPFMTILNKNDLTPSSCLFIDDNRKNIEIAKSIGMKTLHFKGMESVKSIYHAIEIG